LGSNLYNNWEERTEAYIKQLKRYVVFDERKFRNWFKTKETNGNLFDAMLYYQCMLTVKRLKKGLDKVVVVTGQEGSGKTTLGFQVCATVDPNFCNRKICFDSLEFTENLEKNTQGEAAQLDEGGLTLFSREAMTKGVVNMVKAFMVIRQKALFFTICIPQYRTLDSYIKERCSLIIHVLGEGNYKAIHGKGIKIANELSRKGYTLDQIKFPKGTFYHGAFANKFPKCIDMVEYKARKDRAIQITILQLRKEAMKTSGDRQKLLNNAGAILNESGLS
jgi:hypothetical protein